MVESATEVAVSETLCRADVRRVRALLDRAFEGDFGENDWLHAVGGHHVIVRHAGVVVSHAAVVARTIQIGTTAQRVGYVEAVATDPAVQGAGHGTRCMRVIADVIEEHDGVGVLSTGEHGFYERRGWRRWEGPTWVRRRDRSEFRTPDDDGGVMIWTPAGGSTIDVGLPMIDVGLPITCDEREGDDW
jgi:aminoglycoside 2'-N-acetyltransferase I